MERIDGSRAFQIPAPGVPTGLTVMVIGVVLLWIGSRLTSAAKGDPRPLSVIIGEALLLIAALLLIGLMLIGTPRL